MKTVEETIAQAMDCTDTGIIPFLPYILQEFWEIGPSANSLLEIVRENTTDYANLKILDIGCGKGAVSILLAKELQCTCVGIDALKEFINTAKGKAHEEGISERCKFIGNDARERIKKIGSFDVIILGSVGQVFGDYTETMVVLKDHLTSDGLIILDDGYIDDKSAYKHEQAIRKSHLLEQIERAGMNVVKEYLGPEVAKSTDYDEELENIIKRCTELGEKHPEKKSLFDGYIQKQEDEYSNLRTEIICSTMVIRRKK